MLEVIQLECERDDRRLFTNLSFTLSPGELLQIEGRNGAGKTTLLRILAGLSTAWTGRIFWQGKPMAKVYGDFRLACYFLGHRPGLKLELTPLENLSWRLQLANSPAAHTALYEALEKVGLSGYEQVPCSHLSAGQLRRVALAGLLACCATLWILDEPFTAIDVDGVSWLESLLSDHGERGGMVLVTSHQPLKAPRGHLRKLKLESFSGASLSEKSGAGGCS
ncbi:MAG: cytochrome c biogenesis heme-transporting ATPase CcmA [Endozoicomonas sp.]